MKKTILITGATDGIGLETSKALVGLGHKLLLHGRNPAKLEAVSKAFSSLTAGADTEYYVADLSDMADVAALAKAVTKKHAKLDVLINNAGVYRVDELVSPHPDALNTQKCEAIVRVIEAVLTEIIQ